MSLADRIYLLFVAAIILSGCGADEQIRETGFFCTKALLIFWILIAAGEVFRRRRRMLP